MVAGAVGGAEAFLESHATTHERFNRVVGQVEGFETPFGLELLATVHRVATQEQAVSKADVERATYGWAPRKHQFSPGQIAWAMERLRSEGWLSV